MKDEPLTSCYQATGDFYGYALFQSLFNIIIYQYQEYVMKN